MNNRPVLIAKRPSINTMLELAYASIRHVILSVPFILSEKEWSDEIIVRNYIESNFCHRLGRFYMTQALQDAGAIIDHRSCQRPFFEKIHSDFIFVDKGNSFEVFPSVLTSDIISGNDPQSIIDAPYLITKDTLSVESFSHKKTYVFGTMKRKNAQRNQFYAIDHYGYQVPIKKYCDFATNAAKKYKSMDDFIEYMRDPEVYSSVSKFMDEQIPVENIISVFYSPLLYITGVFVEDESKIEEAKIDAESVHARIENLVMKGSKFYSPELEVESPIKFFNLHVKNVY